MIALSSDVKQAAIVVMVLLCAGCAQVHWHKAGATEAVLEEDLVRCRQEARLQAGQEVIPYFTAPLMIGADPQRRPIVVQTHQRESERLLNEQDLTRTCMRDKGYDLIRAEKVTLRQTQDRLVTR